MSQSSKDEETLTRVSFCARVYCLGGILSGEKLCRGEIMSVSPVTLPRLQPGEWLQKIGADGVAQLVSQERQRHSVNVSGRRQRRWVDVGVRVDPDHPEVRVDPRVAGDRPDGQAVVAAYHDALTAGQHRLFHRVGNLRVHSIDGRLSK